MIADVNNCSPNGGRVFWITGLSGAVSGGQTYHSLFLQNTYGGHLMPQENDLFISCLTS